MLHRITNFQDIDKRALMDIYAEGNAENAADLYPNEDIETGIALAEKDFLEFLEKKFFTWNNSVYWVLEEDGRCVSALRTTETEPGIFYIEALETRPDMRRRGCAVRLINELIAYLKPMGAFTLRSCVNKHNAASLRTHEVCGFRVISETGYNPLYDSVNELDLGMEYVFVGEEKEKSGIPCAREAKRRLIEGNLRYLNAVTNAGDVSPQLRARTANEGQRPYAIIITCSDSRVIPESIFSAGIGELFVIRVAGNVLDNHQLGSIEYAAEHLGTKLIVMLGHTRCGAVAAAIEGHSDGFIGYILKDISEAIGSEKDDFTASCLNVRHGVARIREELTIHPIDDAKGLEVVGAIYHVDDGRVEFLQDA